MIKLKTLQEFLAEKFGNTVLGEMAFSKKECEKKITSLEPQINLHLIKVLAFEDDINFNKHIKDIVNWLIRIQKLDFNKHNNKFSKEFYFSWLFSKPITDEYNIKYIDNTINRDLRNYKNLKRKMTNEKVLINLHKIHLEISKLLANDEILDIEDNLYNIKDLDDKNYKLKLN